MSKDGTIDMIGLKLDPDTRLELCREFPDIVFKQYIPILYNDEIYIVDVSNEFPKINEVALLENFRNDKHKFVKCIAEERRDLPPLFADHSTLIEHNIIGTVVKIFKAP